MNLKPRFMLFTLGVFFLSALIVWGLAVRLSESILEEWAVRYIEKQVLYDKSRTLQPILREVALSKQFARSQQLITWAQQPSDELLKQHAIDEMETYRENFSDQSYFVALLSSGEYYHNNAENQYQGDQYRYTLDPKREADSWFYGIVEQNRDLHINVNPDVELGVTKLWIDVLMRDPASNILGVVGTGLDLTEFINRVVSQSEPGINSLFIDHLGAIQVYRDQSMIDFSSISKDLAEQKTFAQLLSDPKDQQAVKQMMQQLESMPNGVMTRFISINGQRHLAGIAYIPEIGWFEITLMDLAVVLPVSMFSGILLSFALMLLLSMWLIQLALNHYIINPLKQLENATSDMQRGYYPASLDKYQAQGEIGRLLRHFRTMAESVQLARETLEQKVSDRTQELEKISQTDSLTELLNRRGMQSLLEYQLGLFQREGVGFGVIWLDIDHFKELNDKLGHSLGDQALKSVAKHICGELRSYDGASRWGGDEFLILVQTDQPELLGYMSERIRERVEAHHLETDQDSDLKLTLSAGSYFAKKGDTLDEMLHAADNALYQAKAKGRNCHIAA